jgi:carbon storage regulator
MLILNRRMNESIVIGANITVTVLAIHGQQVRLGISAPREVVVDREEVHARKLAEYTLTPSHA